MTTASSRAAGGLLAAAALLVLTACGSSGNSDAKAPATTNQAASSSPSPTDPQAADKAAVLKAYRALWEARTRTYAKAKLDPAAAQHAANTALSNIRVTLAYYQDHGTVMRGKPVIAPRVTAVDTASKPAKATITDCVDTSHYTEVERKSGKEVPVGTGPRRHVYTATAVTVGGTWKIWTTKIDRGQTC